MRCNRRDALEGARPRRAASPRFNGELGTAAESQGSDGAAPVRRRCRTWFGLGRELQFSGNPSGLAVLHGQLWVAFGRGTSLGRVDLATGALTRFPLGHKSPGFLVAIDGDLWTSTADGFVLRVAGRTGQVVATFAVPGTPAEVAAGPSGIVWAAEKERNTLTRIDPVANRIVDVTGAGPGAFSVVLAAGDMWVTSFAGNDVWRFAGG
jgi:streptogramin lyase